VTRPPPSTSSKGWNRRRTPPCRSPSSTSSSAELTNAVTNEDDATALLCVFRGAALREQGHLDAARAALKEALRSRSRDPAVRHRALLERARTFLAQNQRALARKDLERILGDDAAYPGLQELLDAASAR
jgi:hypothetical protein